MRSKLLYLRVQAFLADEDDAGDVLNVVALNPADVTRSQLADHLAAIDRLCAERSRELTSEEPGRG